MPARSVARKLTRRKKTRAEHIASLEWNLKDATEALHNAVAMQNWAGVKKYTAQLEKLQRKLFLAERVGSKRLRREPWSHPGPGTTAGNIFGRGRLP